MFCKTVLGSSWTICTLLLSDAIKWPVSKMSPKSLSPPTQNDKTYEAFTSYIFKHTQKHSVHKWVHIAFSLLLFQVFQNPNSMRDDNWSPRSYSRISSTWDLPRMRYDQAQEEPKSCSRAWLWPPYHKSARPPPHSSYSSSIMVKHWCALLEKSKQEKKNRKQLQIKYIFFHTPVRIWLRPPLQDTMRYPLFT
jgi:hypothetical protein